MSTNTDKKPSFLFEGEFFDGYTFSIRTKEPDFLDHVADVFPQVPEKAHDVLSWAMADGWQAYPAYGCRAVAGAVPHIADPAPLTPDSVPPHLRTAWCCGWCMHQERLVSVLVKLQADAERFRRWSQARGLALFDAVPR